MKFYNFFVLSSDFGCIQEKNDYNLLLTLFTFYVNLNLKWVTKSLKVFIILRVIKNFKKIWIFAFFGNIFVNYGLKHSVLGPFNAEFCYLPYYYEGEITHKIKQQSLKMNCWKFHINQNSQCSIIVYLFFVNFMLFTFLWKNLIYIFVITIFLGSSYHLRF